MAYYRLSMAGSFGSPPNDQQPFGSLLNCRGFPVAKALFLGILLLSTTKSSEKNARHFKLQKPKKSTEIRFQSSSCLPNQRNIQFVFWLFHSKKPAWIAASSFISNFLFSLCAFLKDGVGPVEQPKNSLPVTWTRRDIDAAPEDHRSMI